MKVFEKLAPKLRLGECQLTDTHPNVLALALDGAHEYICHDENDSRFESGVGWALDELTTEQPRGGKWDLPSLDPTLDGWIEWRARDLMRRQELTTEEYCDTYPKQLSLPQRISAYLLFGQEGLVLARLNYNATHRIAHAQISEIESFFSRRPRY